LRSSRYGLQKKWFSDNSEKDLKALLRALQSDSPEQPRPNIKEKRQRQSKFSGLGTTKSSSSNKGNPPPRGTRDRARNAKTTLDDFFANMDGSGTTSLPKQTRSRGASHSSFENVSKTSPSVAEKKVDMSSFFDEVDAIMEEKKASIQSHESGKLGQQRDLFSSSGSTGKSSIFDMLPRPEKPTSPNAYEEEAYEQYSDMLERVLENPKFQKKHRKRPLKDDEIRTVIEWLKSDEPVVRCNLPFLESALKGEITEDQDVKAAEIFRGELTAQKTTLMEHYGWTPQQHNAAVGGLVSIGNMCASIATAPPLEVAWQKLKEAGYKMDKETLINYLYVASTFSVRSTSSLSIKGGSILDFLNGTDDGGQENNETEKESEDAETIVVDSASEIATCHDFLFDPSEQSTSIRVRMLVAQGKPKEAERLLDTNSVSGSNDVFCAGDFDNHLLTQKKHSVSCRRLTILDSEPMIRSTNATLTKEMYSRLSNCTPR
jgi:hypothetical protein